MIPIVAGLALGALMGGGIAALQKKDILQGALMGGIGGAVGGAFMPAAGVAGSVAEGAVAGGIGGGLEGVAGSSILNPAVGASGMGASAVSTPSILGQSVLNNSVTSGGLPSVIGQSAVNAAAPLTVAPLANPSLTTAASGVASGAAAQPFSIGNFLTQNKYALAGGALGGMAAKADEPDQKSQGNIDSYGFERQLNPRRNEPGQSYYLDRFISKGSTPVEDFYAADGGIVGLAGGGIAGYSSLGFGEPQDFRVAPMAPVDANMYQPAVSRMSPEVAAYNQQMMQRANQQYNVNPRPAALQVPGIDRPAAPVASGVDPGFNQTPAIGPTDYIDDYYQQMLGRNADPTGRKLIESAVGKSWYDPARDIPEVIRQSEEFKQAGKNPNPTGIEIGKKYAVGAPSTGGGIGGLGFDPKTGRYTGTFEAPGNKKTDVQRMREELDALKSEQSRYNDTGGGEANGGLMRAYAMGGDIGTRYQSPDDASGMGDKVGAHQTVNMAPHYPMQGLYQGYAGGGHLGDYSDGGRLLKGPGDGVSDDIPAQIGRRQPARLADGEFVVPARIVSELGNGSTDAGAKRLYAMMDRVQRNRTKSVGKGKVAVDSKAYKHLPV